MKDNYREIRPSPLQPWPGRYFVFAEVKALRLILKDSHTINPVNQPNANSRNIHKVFRNVPVKLYKPSMKSDEVKHLLQYLEPLGFKTNNLEEDYLFVMDTFTKVEAFMLYDFLNNLDYAKCWIQEAHFPLPFDFGFGGLCRNEKSVNSGVIDFSYEKNFHIGFEVFGYFDVDDYSSYLTPSKERLFLQKIIGFIGGEKYKFKDDFMVDVERRVDQYQEEERQHYMHNLLAESGLIEEEFEKHKKKILIEEDDFSIDSDSYYNEEEIDEIRGNYDPDLYNYYYDDNYDFEDLDED